MTPADRAWAEVVGHARTCPTCSVVLADPPEDVPGSLCVIGWHLLHQAVKAEAAA
jgi:hypothetical protein